VYRLANTEVSSFTSSTVVIEDEEIKGKIIGKEGRNIKAFERVAGVEVLVDENPKGIVVSCFDSVRRAIAVNALEMLIKDGRIQPAKIEECVEKAKKDIGLFIRKKGEEAVLACGLLSIPDALIPLIGRLYFRTSYGQNVLDHSVEMAHIAGMLASELGANVQVAKAGALLHDIGKAVDHEIQGTHVEIGRKILAKYGVDEQVILAMQAHHEEYPYETIESVLVQVADAISGGRPGARRDTVDRYINRLQDLEALALSFMGIEKVYALQAGREIRVFVTPTLVSDLEARELARNIAIRIEQELRYPGEIKINVIRESRTIEFAR
jgi:ribonuclease Y